MHIWMISNKSSSYWVIDRGNRKHSSLTAKDACFFSLYLQILKLIWMHIYICIYIYVYIYIYIYIYISILCVHMYIYIYVCVCVSVYLYMCIILYYTCISHQCKCFLTAKCPGRKELSIPSVGQPRGAVWLRGHRGHQDIIGTSGAFAPNQQIAKAWMMGHWLTMVNGCNLVIWLESSTAWTETTTQSA